MSRPGSTAPLRVPMTRPSRGVKPMDVSTQMPLRTEYELTALGRSLFEPMFAGCAWNRSHGAELADAREAYALRAIP